MTGCSGLARCGRRLATTGRHLHPCRLRHVLCVRSTEASRPQHSQALPPTNPLTIGACPAPPPECYAVFRSPAKTLPMASASHVTHRGARCSFPLPFAGLPSLPLGLVRLYTRPSTGTPAAEHNGPGALAAFLVLPSSGFHLHVSARALAFATMPWLRNIGDISDRAQPRQLNMLSRFCSLVASFRPSYSRPFAATSSSVAGLGSSHCFARGK
jgi:hypothetical protein